MLQEPLLVVAAFYILFFTVIIYVRLDFSITKVPFGFPPTFASHLAPLVMCFISFSEHQSFEQVQGRTLSPRSLVPACGLC